MPRNACRRISLVFSLLVVFASEKNDYSVLRLRKDLTYLTSDECEGRGAQTAGIHKAADYIATEFKQLGLKPGGTDGTYFQPFKMRTGRATLGSPNRLV